jgi:KDO2-lipid IV(A) lauroyltransferase
MFQQFLDQGRRCQLHLGHSFNWEYANSLLPYFVHPFIVVYMPVRNKTVDRLLNHLRSRTGTILVAATRARQEMMPYRRQPYLLALVADQAPGSPENAYWLNFFGKPAGFVRSPERGARAGDIPVIFVHFYKTARGKYRAKLFLGSDAPARLPEGRLTRQYVEFLEWSIREQPALYLWSHRRWKHEWKEEYGEMTVDR